MTTPEPTPGLHQELLERVNSAIQAAGVRAFDWDLVGNHLTLDQTRLVAYSEAVRATATDPGEFINRIVHPDDLARFRREMGKALKHKTHVVLTYRAIHADGTVRPVQLHGQVFRDAAGTPTRLLGVTVDMTAQVEAAEKVEAQARELRTLVEQQRVLLERFDLATRVGGLGVWDWNVVADRVDVDTSLSSVFGFDQPAIEANARDFLTRIVHPHDQEVFNQVLDHAIESGDTFSHRYRVVTPDGTTPHLQVNGHVFRDAHGKATRLLGVTTNVTAEMRRTELLQRQADDERALRDRLNLATETAGIGVWDMDLATRNIIADDNVYALLDFDGRLNEPALMDLIHAEDRDTVMAALGSAIRGGTEDRIISIRHRIARGDGQTRHIQTHIRLFRDTAARPVRILGVTWDVDDEVTRAGQLQQQAQRVQTLLDRFSVAIETAGISPWEIDARTGNFIWAENRLQAFGLAELPLSEYGPALVELIHPDDRAELLANVREAIASQKPSYSCRYRLLRPDGLIRHMQSHAHIVRDEKNEAVRLLGATTDITNEVQTNELLQRQAEHERALLDRLNIATQAAGISSWEIDLTARKFLWVENPLPGLQLDDSGNYSLESYTERMHPDDQSIFADQLDDAFVSHRERISYRYRACADDGRLLHVQAHARLVADDSGRATRLLGVSWDVTKEVEASIKLEEQAAHERMLLDRLSMSTQAAGISSWEIDLDTREFLWADNSLKALNGETDLSGSSDLSLERIHPDDRKILHDSIRHTLKAKHDRFSCRYRGIGIDGNIVHVQTHGRLLYNEAGWARRLLGVSWDVTKEIEASERLRQQAQQLRDAEKRLERASLLSSEGHWELDLTTGYSWMSSSYHALLGYREGELPTSYLKFRELEHPEDVARSQAQFNLHISNGEPYDTELRIRTASGDYRWFRRRGAAERDASGTPISMSGSLHDIHQQKLVEDALKLAQRRFERAINGTQDGLWELESDGVAWCSPRIGELLGYAAAELASDTNFLRLFLHPDDANAVAVATQAHFQQELPYDVEIRLRTKTGDYRWYRARASAERDANGRPLRLSGSLQDVTEARAAREDLMRATEAAESANRAKSEFLANVSHEIRTPMNGIIGMTGLLLDTALDRTQRDYADTIRGSADSLLIVINDILDFSKIEAGKLDIEAIELDLRGNVEDVGGMLAFQAAAKNLELVVHVHPQVPDRVIGDPQRIRQCLINLVGNAIKFTRSGEIVIEVTTVGVRDGKVLTQFEVRDTGIGIAPQTLNTLFQPFVQADSSTTRHFGGTGLGLSIVRRLVDMMGGQVGVDSKVDKGSTFWFMVPLETAAQPMVSVPLDLSRLGRRVLVVDDNETNRRVLAGQLMHAGYEVSLASGGSEALRMLRHALADAHPFEVVLADYKMHDMDGATLGQCINSDPHLSCARIIVLTSLDRHGDMRRFASLGFAGYLTKPVRARELFECMDRVLSRDAKEWHMQSQPIVTRGTLVSNDSVRRYEGHVLLVEDNPVNQKVAVRFLERMGCKVRVADNGAEGVKAWAEARFDIVLMDLQMPVMDGLTATRRIRELEGGTGRSTPIVALTANAMAGQLERCMEAGMNGFLTKPLEIARLHETLDRYGLGAALDTGHSLSIAGGIDVPVDLARLNELTDGDPEFAHELAATFIASGTQVMQEVREALTAFDRAALGRAGHKLKGASANIYAEGLRAIAYELETHGSGLDQPRLKELVERLEVEFLRAAAFLKQQTPAPEKKVG